MFDISNFKSVTSTVNNICSPLFKHFAINYFRLLRIYKDGGRVMLSTNSEVLDFFYTDGWYKYAWLDGDHPKIDQKVVVWQVEKILHTTEAEKEIGKFLSGLSIKEGYAFIYEFEDFYECYDIASPDLQIYKIDINLLQRFCFYFKQEAAWLLHDLSVCTIKLPVSKQLSIGKEVSDYQEFLEKTKISKYHFDSDDTYLTHRELECVYHKIKGFSAKEIGKLLNVSNRTVEVHLEKARQKVDFFKYATFITSNIIG